MTAIITKHLDSAQGRLLAAADSLFVDHGIFRVWWTALAPVGPGLWRSNQPGPSHLAAAARRGIHTVINLRGRRNCGSYVREVAACARLGLELIDFPVNSRSPPEPERLHQALELFDRIRYPALMHCKSGADRAGLMSVFWLVTRGGVPVAEALRRHLSLRFLHIRQGRTGVLDHFFERYLADTAGEPMPFMTWVDTRYDPVRLKAESRSRGWADLLVDQLLRRE